MDHTRKSLKPLIIHPFLCYRSVVLADGRQEGTRRGVKTANQHQHSAECDPVPRGRDGAEYRDGRPHPPGAAAGQTRRGNQTHLRKVP